jgi:pilus assembly protein Flp/PilA
MNKLEGSMSENTKALLRRFMSDESGISAVEYGLLAAGIAVGLWAIVGGPTGIGTSLQNVLGDVQADLTTAAAD